MQAIFFDVGDTLIHIPEERPARIVQSLARYGVTVDFDAAHAAALQADISVRPPGWKAPATIAEEDAFRVDYARHLLNHLGLVSHDAADPQPTEPGTPAIDPADLVRGFHYSDYAICYPETHEVLAALQGRVRLGVISNAFPRLSEVLDRLDLSPYFEIIINSSIVDAWKPEPAIYELALAAMGVPAELCAFVDDLPPNIATAERLGFTSLLVDRQGAHGGLPHRRIADLWPILDLPFA